MTSISPLIQIKDLHKSYGSSHILNGINLEIARSELLVLIGPSGCGKSTLLRCINGLEIFDQGALRVCDFELLQNNQNRISLEHHHERTAKLRHYAGMVFQSFNLFPHMTLIENIMAAPRIVQNLPAHEVKQIAEELLNKVGLASHSHKYPAQLSGGQQQRGAIARALAVKPQIMLYDEPTSALDPGLTDEVWQVMRQLDQEGMTQIVVTHEMRFAKSVADRVAFIDHGHIVESAPPNIIFTSPKDARTREFLKHHL